MAKLIVAASQKGGVGKSTIIGELAVILSNQGYKVLICDADEQGTLTQFITERNTLSKINNKVSKINNKVSKRNNKVSKRNNKVLDFLAINCQVLKNSINDYCDKYDFLLIDTPGINSSILHETLKKADLVISVFNPESFTLWTMETMESIILGARQVNKSLLSYALLNRGWHSGADNEASISYLKESFDFMFKTVIGQRKSFMNALGEGCSVTEKKHRNYNLAAKEIKSFVKECLEILKITIKEK